jgi:hypothetical protein
MKNLLMIAFFLPFFSFSQPSKHYIVACTKKGKTLDSLSNFNSRFVFDSTYVKYTHNKTDSTYKVAEMRYNNVLSEFTYFIRSGEAFYYYPQVGSIIYHNNKKVSLYGKCVIVY